MSGGTCRYCGRPILWFEKPTGGWVPLDPDPDPLGTVAVRDGENVPADTPGAKRYRKHFGTCEKD